MSSSSLASGASPAAADERVPMGRVWRAGLVAIAAAVVANLVVWVIAQAIFDISDDCMPLATPWPAAIFTVLALALGVGLFALLNRFTRKPITRFRQVAVVALLLSLLSPLSARGQDGSSTAAILTLEAMHVVAFAVFFPLMTTRTRDR